MQQQRQMHQMPGNYPPPYPQQRPRAPQMVGFQGGGFTPDQQYALQGLKPPVNPQQIGGVLQQSLQGQPNQGVMGPPTPQHMQQHVMQSVRSPPPIKSPQPTPSTRAAPSPRGQPSPSPRTQQSPHHMPSHSPAPQVVGVGNDMHNHMHPHQSPVPGVPPDNIGGPIEGGLLNAQDQLSKYVEQL